MLLKIFQNISLTKGINEKKYRSISEQVIKNLPLINDWLNENLLKKIKCLNGNESLKKFIILRK